MQSQWTFVSSLLVVTSFTAVVVTGISGDFNDALLEATVEQFGTNRKLSVKELDAFLPVTHAEEPSDDRTSLQSCQALTAKQDIKSCIKTKCFTTEKVFQLYSIPQDGATVTQVGSMCAALLYMTGGSNCSVHEKEYDSNRDLEVWGLGFLCVTIISACSLGGAIFITVMNRPFWTRVMVFMVALGAGALAGSGILVLIPEAFELHTDASPRKDDYIWISTTIMAGVYLFLLTERLLKIAVTRRQRKQLEAGVSNSVQLQSTSEVIGAKGGTDNQAFNQQDTDLQGVQVSNGGVAKHQDDLPMFSLDNLSRIKSVAWMIVFGDALHNFIDGLAIGAGFVENTYSGLSISLAVVCEELPHELGDFAILLNSGMSMRMALLCNFLSACTCFLGLVVGISLGELSHSGKWIFAIAGGMFLYISFVDMLPEMNHAAEEEEKRTGGVWLVFGLQHAGMLIGFAIILFLAVFGSQIDIK